MAYQTGALSYRGSFKSIRNYRNAKDPNTYAGEKGGASDDKIKNSPVFVRTRENMSEFKGCGVVVKAIRRGLSHLIPEHTDTHFTARLTTLIKKINVMDLEGERGKRAIRISQYRTILKNLYLHEKRKIDFQLKRCITNSHPESRAEATIMVNGFNPDPALVPRNAEFYRILIHISKISDFAYSENVLGYAPLSPLLAMSAFAYSDYIPVNTPLTGALKAAFSEGTVLTESDTVLQCVGIEFYIRSGADEYVPYKTGSMIVRDVF